ISDEPGAAGEQQRELVSSLHAVVEAENAVLRQGLDAERKLRRRVRAPDSWAGAPNWDAELEGADRGERVAAAGIGAGAAERPQPGRAARAAGHDGASVVTCPGSWPSRSRLDGWQRRDMHARHDALHVPRLCHDVADDLADPQRSLLAWSAEPIPGNARS